MDTNVTQHDAMLKSSTNDDVSLRTYTHHVLDIRFLRNDNKASLSKRDIRM